MRRRVELLFSFIKRSEPVGRSDLRAVHFLMFFSLLLADPDLTASKLFVKTVNTNQYDVITFSILIYFIANFDCS